MPKSKQHYREKLQEVAKNKQKGNIMKKGDYMMYKFIFNEIDLDNVGVISK